LTSVFFILPVYGFQKNCKIFCVVLLYRFEILSKKSAKLWTFFQKNLRYLKSKISTKFNCLLFFSIFLGFLAFCFVFHLSKVVQKLWNFLWCFIGRVRDFTNDFLENSKSSFKKNIDMSNILFFSKFCGLLFVFYFFIIFDILFSISSICTCQKILQIFMFFYFMDYIFY